MKSLNVNTIIKMINEGSKKIADNFLYINELNIFPVPDGDTGTNMKISISTSVDKINNLSNLNELSLFEFKNIFTKELLMNSRGNSGVIFSRIFRGFFSVVKEDIDEINIKNLADAFIASKEQIYKDVKNPVEGTILTVIRELSEDFPKKMSNFKNMIDAFKFIYEKSIDVVERTTDMLPQLKEAGVVDSGAYGLQLFFEGMYFALVNLSDDSNLNENNIKKIKTKNANNITKKIQLIDNVERQEISEEGFGYCCEYILKINYRLFPEQQKKSDFDIVTLEKDLLKHGNSLVLVHEEDIVKVHIHSYIPYKILEISQKYGEFLKIKFENMTEQFLEKYSQFTPEEIFKKNKLSNNVKVIATVPTVTLGKYFKSEFGIHAYIDTDRTGNPTINDFNNKIVSLKSKNIIIVTDDSNIILAAEQAIALNSNRINFALIRAKNPIEALLCLLYFDNNLSLRDNQRIMEKALKFSLSAKISTSIKSLATKNNIVVNKGDFIGLKDKEIISSSKNFLECFETILKKIISRKKPNYIFIIHNNDLSDYELNNISKKINENYNIKCNIINGRQKTYFLYIGYSFNKKG